MAINRTALIEIYGIHGEHWVVSGDGMGAQGVELAQDPEGLFDEAPFTTVWQQSAYQEGASFVVSNADPIDMVLGFNIFADESKGMEWEAVESAFYGSFGVDPRGELAEIVVTTNSGVRRMGVVKNEKSVQKSKYDPRLSGHSTLMLTLRGPKPRWEGLTHLSTWTANAANASGTIRVFNPTDTDMWLQWSMTGAGVWTIPDRDWAGGARLNRRITTPMLNSPLTIDTHPLRESYTAGDGSNIAGRFGGVDFLYPVPAHTPSTGLPVSITAGMASGNTIQCRMVEQWQRPAGGALAW